MRRFTSMKIAFTTVLSCLALLVGMFATTATASAHSSNSAHHDRPTINVFDVERFGNCVSFTITGFDFSAGHHATLFARGVNGEEDLNIDPDHVRINRHGEFETRATVCTSFQFENCGEFIDNPFSFCGFGLNPGEFCNSSFNFEPNEFCFGQPNFTPGCGSFCGPFHPVPVFEFCRFHNVPFCFIHRHHRISFFVNAHDDHSGRNANGAFISIG